jgi:hypothetical protein
MTGPLSIRTQVRDAFLSALQTIEASPTVRVPGAQILTHYATVDELKKYPAYCVVVTNEELEVRGHGFADVTMTVLVVIYVRSEADVRAVLDGAIEDVIEALRNGQLVKPIIPYLELQGIETDEGTSIVKPFAQAVLRWTAHMRRPINW